MAQSSSIVLQTYNKKIYTINVAALECQAGDKLVVHLPSDDYTPESMNEFSDFLLRHFAPSNIIYTSTDGGRIVIEAIRHVSVVEGE